jgi:IS1 family transposase
VVDRTTRFVVAHATGRIGDDLVAQAVGVTVQRTQRRPLTWYSDGWRGYRDVLVRAYRQPVATGRPGRPRLVVPATVRLTQTVKHRDTHGHLQSVEVVAALGEVADQPGTTRVERLNGSLRDHVNALTRKTHAFAKRDATWDALVGLALFTHNWLRPHPASRHDTPRSSPALALGLTDHIWSWQEFLTTPV